MKNPSAVTEVFHGLPVEHCPLCGELISIEKSEIMQLEEINCKFCMRSIKAYLPKHDGQLFFTKECNNCGKMNNTKSVYCVFCGHDYSYIRKRFKLSVLILVGFLTSSPSIVGIVLIFKAKGPLASITGYTLVVIGLVLSLIVFTNKRSRRAAIPGLIVSGIVIFILAIFYIILVITLSMY